ncbi:hypothetical protein BH09SUM1_BH09SUM1_08240 [soil metagenome]
MDMERQTDSPDRPENQPGIGFIRQVLPLGIAVFFLSGLAMVAVPEFQRNHSKHPVQAVMALEGRIRREAYDDMQRTGGLPASFDFLTARKSELLPVDPFNAEPPRLQYEIEYGKDSTLTLKGGPLRFLKTDTEFFIISNGPNKRIDFTERSQYPACAYDPTNGIESGGDIIGVLRKESSSDR